MKMEALATEHVLYITLLEPRGLCKVCALICKYAIILYNKYNAIILGVKTGRGGQNKFCLSFSFNWHTLQTTAARIQKAPHWFSWNVLQSVPCNVHYLARLYIISDFDREVLCIYAIYYIRSSISIEVKVPIYYRMIFSRLMPRASFRFIEL